MATLDEFNNQNNQSDNQTDNVIVNPNLKRKFKPIPDANQMKRIDPVKDLGLKSAEQEAEENREPDDLEKAFKKIDEINEKRSREYDKYVDLFEQTDGEFTKEEYIEEVKDGIDYESMLSNVPDPLNRELVEFSKKQMELAMEEARNNGEVIETHFDDSSDSFDEPPVNNVSDDELLEDDEIIEEMNAEIEGGVTDMIDETMPPIPDTNDSPLSTLHDAIDNVKEEPVDNQPPSTVDDGIPSIDVGVPKMDKKPDIKDIKKAIDNQTDIKIPESVPSLYDLDIDKELAELENDSVVKDSDDAEKKYQERLKIIQGEVKKKIIPIASNFNITGFAISNKPISISNALNMANNDHSKRQAMWVLPSTGFPIVMNEFTGPEIDNIAKVVSVRNKTVHDINQQFNPLYNHIASPKPDNLDGWLQTISIMDIKHLYASVYKACFEGINFLPYDCTKDKCNNGFISNDMPFEKMVKYKDTDTKNKVDTIYRTNPAGHEYKLYVSEVLPVSNTYAMSFRNPSIYDALKAPAYLDADWRNKMDDIVALATYIDKIFVIDSVNHSLRPLGIKEWEDDPKKTLKAKVLAIAKVVESLTSDQYNLISAYIEEINKDNDFMDYQRPECYCPKCHTKIEAEDESSIELLFMRHRLTSLVAG